MYLGNKIPKNGFYWNSSEANDCLNSVFTYSKPLLPALTYQPSSWFIILGDLVMSDVLRPQAIDNRRQVLIKAACRAIAEKGFEGLRLRDVALAASIDHSTLHHYFPTKEDLITASVEHATRQFWPTIPPSGPTRERLHGHLGALTHLIGTQPELFALLAELDQRAMRDARLRATIEAHEQGWRGALTRVLNGDLEDTPSTEEETAANVELVIATVKGVRLYPDKAGPVLRQLERLLTCRPADS